MRVDGQKAVDHPDQEPMRIGGRRDQAQGFIRLGLTIEGFNVVADQGLLRARGNRESGGL